ncbi:GIY-YIG nuclease family protein [Dyadobacter chenhuakuii]|uniref:GIY-YIG nuclease family protein n=1 Tax=Dyadobacter chenhuakuii TaxID=2909339 RepID=A0A9X1QDW0_9BACT|nr:GIY-YIG nuclease family protein [Dyadobacter chenhuakuii]MCF2500068.1 GIY-YIG nuclease family protein [Dyadobacter chenhuakuii]
MRIYYVYILKCSDGSYYTGVTNCLERRFTEHVNGRNVTCYTFTRRPVELVFFREFGYVNDAIAFEKQVKGWSRKKKEAIINGDWDGLRPLAECYNNTHSRNKDTDLK